MSEFDRVMKGVNWIELRAQVETLTNVLRTVHNQQDNQELRELRNLIYNLQDAAVISGGWTDEEVFGPLI